MPLELILDHWWQFLLVLAGLTLAAKVIGLSLEGTLKALGSLVVTLGREFTGRTSSQLSAFVNILMIVFALFVTVLLISPSVLSQLGLLVGDGSGSAAILGVFLLVLVLLVSPWFILQFEKETRDFRERSDSKRARGQKNGRFTD